LSVEGLHRIDHRAKVLNEEFRSMRINFARFVLAICLLAFSVGTRPATAQAHSPELEEGMAAFYREDYDTAQEFFEKALKKNPKDSLSMAYLLHAAFKKKEINEVINKIEQKSVARGEDPIALAHLGMGYFLRGMMIPSEMSESVTEFKQAISQDPNVSMAYTGLGMVYYHKRKMPRAKGYFVRALRVNPDDVMALELYANIMLVNEKKPEDARQVFERITLMLPTYPDAFYYVGSSLDDLGKYEEAIPYLMRARELDPRGLTKGFDAASLIGDVLMKENRVAEAIEAYEQAQSIRPEAQYIEIQLKKARGEDY
jgi:tetratricopeptide (TPR) repeat protein